MEGVCPVLYADTINVGERVGAHPDGSGVRSPGERRSQCRRRRLHRCCREFSRGCLLCGVAVGVIARRHSEHEDFTIGPDIPVMQAVRMMRLYDISQLAVLDEQNQLMGILDESDVLMAVADSTDAFTNPVSKYMTTKLKTLAPDADVHDLLPIFEADRVAIVMDGDNFLGLITRIDLINYLRKKTMS